MRRHSERCKDCKKKVKEMLIHLFGEVLENYNLELPSKIDDNLQNLFSSELNRIYILLQENRGNTIFVKAKKLPKVDFFIKKLGIVLEFDESQHFTKLRKLTLVNYPSRLKTGFDKERWINLCDSLDKKDNHPIYRDEQRAWYDTMRDFAPVLIGLRPTIRLYASDYIWCSLDTKNEFDVEKFREMLNLNL